jgi:DNA-binding FadR family transcriptional regulator
MAKVKPGSAVSRIAAKIREDASRLNDGDLLGSEDELVARYGVSRPTLRQAASLVVQEQLLTVRRGMGGGYFARAPQAHAVGRMAALYLRYHGASRAEILAAHMPLRIELARLAVANEDEAAREELMQFLQTEEGIDHYRSFREFVIAERNFNLLLGRLAGNQALGLFMEILMDLSAIIGRGEDMYRNQPARVADLRRERNALGRAILEREEDFAIAIARRSSRMSSQWHEEDLARRKKIGEEDDVYLTEQSVA